MVIQPGDRFGHYEIQETLGQGGMGVVYRAWDSRLERPVALKFLHPEQKPGDEGRFLKEARAASRLNHPGIVTIYESAEESGQRYLAMELLEGRPLSELLQPGGMSPADFLPLAAQIAAAVLYAHDHGVVHRDLKPENVMVQADRQAKIMDFGLARLEDAKGGMSTTTGITGTPSYMAPEQVSGEGARAPADIWALGVMFYELLTGSLPFSGNGFYELAGAILNEEPLPVDQVRSDLPTRVAGLISRCLEKDPLRRPPATELLLALQESEAPGRPGVQLRHMHIPHNLPAQLSKFVGRARELESLGSMLALNRLVTLTGVGGCGKTRVALEVASRARQLFEHGVWLVDLAPIAGSDSVLRGVAAALGLREDPGRDLLETVRSHVRGRRMLLMVDNCEHVAAESARVVEAMLLASPTLQVLATSRESLGVPGEVCWQVPSMALPGLDEPLDALVQSDALQLFAERAAAAQPGFELSAANAPAVARICARLDGIPLALELAASRIKMLSLEQIELRLSDRFRLLTGGSRTALPRQQTLHATMEWGHALLTPPEQAILRRLSVFAGGWSLDAAEAVCSDEEAATAEIFDLLGRLVEKSFVLMTDARGTARFRFLETVRQFAGGKLVDAGEAPRLRTRHLQHFLMSAQGTRPEAPEPVAGGSGGLRAPSVAAWLDSMEEEIDNLRAALAWALSEPGLAADGLALGGTLYRLWSVRGYVSEGRKVLESALDLARDAPPHDRIVGLIAAGHLARLRSDGERARARLEQAVELAGSEGERRLEALALDGLASVATAHSRPAEAVPLYERALEISREIHETLGESQALNNLGNALLELGEFDRAAVRYEESVRLARRSQGESQTGVALYNLGYTAAVRGDNETAIQSLEEALGIFRRLRHRSGIAFCKMITGKSRLAMGDVPEASRLLEESLEMSRTLEDPLLTANVQMILADVMLYRKLDQPAAALLAASLTTFLEGDKRGEALFCLNRFARLWAQRAEYERAATLRSAAAQLREQSGHSLLPSDGPGLEHLDRALKESLSSERLAELAEAGASLTLEAAAELALKGASPA